MYSIAALTVSTSRKYFTAAQRRVLVEKVNRLYGDKLVRLAEVGNTRKRVAALTFVFKTLADAELASRYLYGVTTEVSKLVSY